MITRELIARGVAGLRSVTDEGDALLALLEELAEAPGPRRRCTEPLDEPRALEVLARSRSVSAAARELGVPRGTLRDLVYRLEARRHA